MFKKDKIQQIAAHKRFTFTLKIHILRVKGQKKIFQASGNPKEAEVAILRADKIVFKIKIVKGDREGH